MKQGGQTRALVLCYEASAYTGTLTSSAEGENRWMTRAEIAAIRVGNRCWTSCPCTKIPT